jgi:hypothetical protein
MNTQPATTKTFDGTSYEILPTDTGYEVTVREAGHELTLVTRDGGSLGRDAYANAEAMVRAGMDAWTADRMAYCFTLAAGHIARQRVAA